MNKIVTLAVAAAAFAVGSAQAAEHTVSVNGKTYTVTVEGDYLGTNMAGVASLGYLIKNGSWAHAGTSVSNSEIADERQAEIDARDDDDKVVEMEEIAPTTTTPVVAPAPVVSAPVAAPAPIQQAPVMEAPVQQAPVVEAPVQQAPVMEAPVQQAPANDFVDEELS